MGLRTKLKNIIKQKLGRDTPTQSTPPVQYPPPQPVQTTVQTPEVEVHPPQSEPTHVESPEEPVPTEETSDPTFEPSPSETESILEQVPVPETPVQEEPQETSEAPQDSSEPEESQESAGDDGAVAVYAIKTLFPENCPNCSASTYGNWKYIGSGFACEKCDTPF